MARTAKSTPRATAAAAARSHRAPAAAAGRRSVAAVAAEATNLVFGPELIRLLCMLVRCETQPCLRQVVVWWWVVFHFMRAVGCLPLICLLSATLVGFAITPIPKLIIDYFETMTPASVAMRLVVLWVCGATAIYPLDANKAQSLAMACVGTVAVAVLARYIF